jgi:nitrite reductase (NADH) small subunit
LASASSMDGKVTGAEFVIPQSEIPEGGSKVVKINGVDVGIFNIGGEFHAVMNWCPHEGGPVCTGYITGTVLWDESRGSKPEWVKDGEVVCCPWHGYEFDIASGRCITRGELRLRRYKIKALDGKITVEM